MKIECPSKTFLIGEYAVLNGGPAILLSTPPYYPYDGMGGFGASGAKFAIEAKKSGQTDIWQILDNYKKSGLSGSGADVVSQCSGGMTYFYAREKMIEKLVWPFEDLIITLIHTGYKINTHEHLEELNQNNLAGLEKIVLECYKAIKNSNTENFLKSINNYFACLKDLSLVCENTQNLLRKINQQPEVLVSKGCGALGADVILCIINKNNKNQFLSWAKQEKLNIVYCDNQFVAGVL